MPRSASPRDQRLARQQYLTVQKRTLLDSINATEASIRELGQAISEVKGASEYSPSDPRYPTNAKAWYDRRAALEATLPRLQAELSVVEEECRQAEQRARLDEVQKARHSTVKLRTF